MSLMNVLTVLMRYTIGVKTRAMRKRNSVIIRFYRVVLMVLSTARDIGAGVVPEC